MAQGGDPTGTGTGGSKLPDLPAEFTNNAHFLRGTVGAARTANPNSANSQFFIMFAPGPEPGRPVHDLGPGGSGHAVRRRHQAGVAAPAARSRTPTASSRCAWPPTRTDLTGSRLAFPSRLLLKQAGAEPVAQLVEHETFNLGVVGSNPTGLTKRPRLATRVFDLARGARKGLIFRGFWTRMECAV